MSQETFPWWSSLRHKGMLIAPSRLPDYFGEQPEPLPPYLAERLRRALTRFEADGSEGGRHLVTTVIHEVCGVDGQAGGQWHAGSDVDSKWAIRAPSGETLRPRRLWEGPNGGLFPVFVDSEKRLGVGRGRRSVSRVVQWLRAADRKVALITNHRQWRLIYAGLDFDAWAEWDVAQWFEEGRPGLQVDALRSLISPASLTPPEPDKPCPLVSAILDSRKGEAELSQVLGERVREAVELLIQAHAPALEDIKDTVKPADIYRAATRVIMRMVVALFAEARELLPRENPIYYGSYSLEGLRDELRRHHGAAAERLRNRYSAWPRVLALFELIYEGCPHEQLPILRYGGGLFRPGDANSHDGVSRALVPFESVQAAPSDFRVAQMLELISTTKVKVRHGKGATWVDAPVDFSDLSSEYIGILYEGLLDFELRQAKADEPMVFLALGDEPALPLPRLEAMDDSALGSLVEKFKVKTKRSVGGDDESDEEDAEGQDEAEEEDMEDEEEAEEETPGPEDEAGDEDDEHQAVRQRAVAWAQAAVRAGKIVPKPRSKKKEAQQQYEADVASAAGKLIKPGGVILPGEWYLVRWGGTRKGAGTFYTRPQLAVPTVQRTLCPLAANPPAGTGGKPNTDAPPREWTPKGPADILALRVCDPAMGSGSFLVASLRYLTDTLYRSLLHHGWLVEKNGRLELGNVPDPIPPWLDECVRDFPLTTEDYESYVRARLRRIVVERSIYGVEIDPLAVELGRLALWVETMDRALPFEFLDHKLKCGNSLVGCWFDRFRDYPLMSWEREGGDKNHTGGVHYQKGQWTKEIKAVRNGPVKTEMVEAITGQEPLFTIGQAEPEDVHDQGHDVYETLAATDVTEPDEREELYRADFEDDEAQQRLRQAFDCWCAVWFWPPDELAAVPTPRQFADPPEETRKVVERLRQDPRLRFFHWELEFPDVFVSGDSGFDAIVGNPPWETLQPSSKEFFSNVDPLYRSYGNQEGKKKQKEYFQTDPSVERDWLEYCAYYKGISNWRKAVFSPYGDGADDGETFALTRSSKRNPQLRTMWAGRRANRIGYAEPKHPFRYQGKGKAYTYRMFLELGYCLLREGGQLGFVVPSGVYSDRGASELRSLFLDASNWRWVFGFENRQGIFDIHRSAKFCPVIVEKGGTTEAIRTAFMHRNLDDWSQAERHAIPYPREQVGRFSPTSQAILEIRARRDLDILATMHENGVLLSDVGPDGWGISYQQGDFNITSDSELFPPLPEWQELSYEPDEYGRWIGPNNEVALPLYEGRMVGQFDFGQKGWVSGKGRGADWRDIEWEAKAIEPQFVMSKAHLDALGLAPEWKAGYMRVTSATNTRTCIATLLARVPCGDKVATMRTGTLPGCLALVVVLNSWVFDYGARLRVAGLQVDYHTLEQSSLPSLPSGSVPPGLCVGALRLAGPHPLFAPEWLRVQGAHPGCTSGPWRRLWAIIRHERVRLRCALDAVVAELYGLEWEDLAWILRDCDHPVPRSTDNAFTRTLDPKGFWRVDKGEAPELRHSVLTLAAFRDLKDMIAAHGADRHQGIEAFCGQNSGDGWMLPEALRLADLGLGHDERAKVAQPVAERLGDRFLPWQLEQSVDESWAECEQHARNILGEDGFKRLMAEIEGGNTTKSDPPNDSPATNPIPATGGPKDLLGDPIPTDLFGQPLQTKPKRRKR